MIICPNCSYHELEGAIICHECGSQLVGKPFPASNQDKVNQVFDGKITQHPSNTLSRENPFPEARLILKLINEGTYVPIDQEADLIIGRIGEGQSVIPDIDLTSYNARNAGVSRLHAELRVTSSEILVLDLGSANGTRINDRRLQPHVMHALQDGDILTLGKFKVEIIIPH